MKKILVACAIAASAMFSTLTIAGPAHYTTEDTAVGDLIDNPKSRAIVDKYIPGFSSSEQIDMARGMTLKSIQAFSPDAVTDDALAKIDADLAKLPVDNK